MEMVVTKNGKIQGKRKDGCTTYFGIPYAKAPVGELRWKAPQPVEPQKRSDILDVIGYDDDGQSTLGWPQAAECFDPLRQTSYWWTNRCDGYPLYTHVHSGNFTGQLFTLLFDPAGGARPGRHGLYPPMFE